MSGKGSSPRPLSVPAHTYAENYVRVFGAPTPNATSAHASQPHPITMTPTPPQDHHERPEA